MILRPDYIEAVKPFMDAPLVKILTGVRRCGKSTIFEMIRQELLERGIPEDHIIMKKYIENFTFSYNIKITNLKLIHENNYFYFLNESNEIIYQIDPYYR